MRILLAALAAFLLLATRAPFARADMTEAERAAILQMVEELRPDAARIRGLEWKHGVKADVISRATLRKNFLKEVREEMTPEEIERDTRILKRIGMLEPDDDLIEITLGMYEDMVAGYYDPKAKSLFLIEGMVGEAQKPVILHELIHALEDQHFDLRKRRDAWEEDSDRLFAEICIEEGSAEEAREIFERDNPEAKRLMEEASSVDMARQMRVIASVPAYMLIDSMLHYDAGPKFVGRHVGEDYAARMDALYRDPPVSQEQILHPGRWFGRHRDHPRGVTWGGDLVAAVGAGWKEWDDGPTGELDLALYLNHHLSNSRGRLDVRRMIMTGHYVSAVAQDAAAGWDAGRSLFLASGDAPLIWISAHAFDSEQDADEAADAMLDALRVQAGAKWRVGAWTATSEGRGVQWRGKHGLGRMLVRGEEIVTVDGAPGDVFPRLWPLLLKTTFPRDPRDEWTPEMALAACDVSDPKRGLGVCVPHNEWAAEPGGATPQAFATLRRGRVEVTVAALDPAPSPYALEDNIAILLRRMARRAAPAEGGPVVIGPYEGTRHTWTDEQGLAHEAYVAAGEGRLFIARARGPAAEIAAARTDVLAILESVVSIAPRLREPR